MTKGDYFHVKLRNQDKNHKRVWINIKHLCVQTINSLVKDEDTMEIKEKGKKSKRGKNLTWSADLVTTVAKTIEEMSVKSQC